MAHFYGEIFGQRRIVSTVGNKSSEISAHIRGWDSGVFVRLTHDNGKDHILVYKTGGSNNPNDEHLIFHYEP